MEIIILIVIGFFAGALFTSFGRNQQSMPQVIHVVTDPQPSSGAGSFVAFLIVVVIALMMGGQMIGG